MIAPHDGEITAAMLVLLDKQRKDPAFAEPHFYVKELRLAVGSHLSMKKILELVTPLAETFDGVPRRPVVEVHKMSEERERKVIVLASSATKAPDAVVVKGHARTDSELAYLQLPELANVPAVLEKPQAPALAVKKGVKIDEQANTTMSIVISHPTQIDHDAQAAGGAILKMQEPEAHKKPPSSLEQLRLELGRPSQEWPTWQDPKADDPAGREETCERRRPEEDPRKDAQQAIAGRGHVDILQPEEHVRKSDSFEPSREEAAAPDSSPLLTARSDGSSSSASDYLRDDVTAPNTAVSATFDLPSSDSDSDLDSVLSLELDTDDLEPTEPSTPAVQKAFSEVTIGSVKPDELTTAVKAWLATRWTYIALDLGVVVGLAVGLQLVM